MPRKLNQGKLRIRDLAKEAAASTKANIIDTFKPSEPSIEVPLVGESKREVPEVKPVKVPDLVDRTLLVRTLTGAVYVAINLLCIFLGKFWCACIMAVTAGICCWEFFRLMRFDAKLPNQVVGIVFAVLMPFVPLADPLFLEGLVFLLIMVLGFWYVIDENVRIIDVAVTAFGTIYTGLTLSALVAIRCAGSLSNEGAIILCIGVMASVWVNDAFAYLVGSAIGKHKMAPRISPKKSWEGFAGGIFGSLLIWCLLLVFPQAGLNWVVCIVCGLLCGATGVIGDLVESRIKRGAGVKDSGNLIPGHGGLLDRSDSMLFVAIAAYFILTLMGVI